MSSGGLWLPAEAVPEQLPPALRFTLLTAGYEEVFGGRSTVDAILDRLKQSSTDALFSILGRIAAVLGAQPNPARRWATQVHIAERVFGKRAALIWRRLRESRGQDLDQDRAVLFHERQVLNLFKLALLALPISRGSADLDSLGEALLMVNDLLDRGLDETRGGPDHTSELEMYIFANIVFNQHPDAVHELVRSYELYIDPRPELLDLPNAVNVPEWIRGATGLEAKVLWRVLYVLFGYWFSLDLKTISDGAHVLDLGWFASMSKVSRAESEAFFRAVGRPVEELQAAVRRAYSLEDPRFFDVVEFAKTPLVFFGNTVHCTSVTLLRAAAGPNVQYRLLDDQKFSKEERRRFLDFRGSLYGDYIDRLFRRAFGARFIDSATLDRELNDVEHCDGIVDYGDEAVLIEVKATLVPLAVSTGEDAAAYSTFMAGAIPRAASQIHETIQAIEGGRAKALGLEAGRFQRYYPVVVTMHLPSNPLTYRERVERGLATHALNQARSDVLVAPLQLIDVHEAELVETAVAAGASFRDLLRAKVGNPDTVHLALNNFYGPYNETEIGKHNPYLAERYHELTEEALDYFRALGLPSGRSGATDAT